MNIPNVTENLRLGPSQSPGAGRSQLARISNTGDVEIVPAAGAFPSARNQVFSDVRYNLILCGFKRCGKTTFGRILAEKLGRRFIDTDELIACERADPAFRKLEKEAILSLSSITDAVIATGGGAVVDPENRVFLKKLGKIIYLELPKTEVRRRVLQDPLPSFLDSNDLEGSFEKMYARRLPIYEQLADTTWQVTDLERFSALQLGESLTALLSAL